MTSGLGRDASAVSCLWILAIVVYVPVVRNGFVGWDDGIYLHAAASADLTTLAGIRTLLTSVVSGNYHPATMAAYAVQHGAFGPNRPGITWSVSCFTPLLPLWFTGFSEA